MLQIKNILVVGFFCHDYFITFTENIGIMQKCVNFAQKILQKELKCVQNQGSET